MSELMSSIGVAVKILQMKRPKYPDENLSRCHFNHHEPHIN